MGSWFLYSRNATVAAIRRLNAEFIVTDPAERVHKRVMRGPRVDVSDRAGLL
jgi:hypothetical protein